MSNITIAGITSSILSTTKNPLNSNESEIETPLKEFRYIILPFIYSIVVFVGLIGNGLVIYIMQVKVRNKNITDVYVLNLAIADFIFVSMLPLWTVHTALDGWPFGSPMCKIASGITYFDMYASVFFLTAMSVDRFIAVVLYQSMRRTMLCTRGVVISLWIFSTILGVIPMYFRGTTEQPAGLPKCDWTFDNEQQSHVTWFLIFSFTRSIVGFLIPLAIILFSYSMIIIFLKRRGATGKLTEKRQDRATKIVLVVIGVFLVCWLPNQISNLIYVIDSLSESRSTISHYYVHMFVTALAFTHSCVNPILYAFMREDLRIKVSMTPKLYDRKQIYANGGNDTQLLKMTNFEVTPKSSLENIEDGEVANGGVKSDLRDEKDSLIAKVSSSSSTRETKDITRDGFQPSFSDLKDSTSSATYTET